MIAWKLAISPATASNANTFAALDPKIAQKPSRIGSPDVPRAKAPRTILVAPACGRQTCARGCVLDCQRRLGASRIMRLNVRCAGEADARLGDRRRGHQARLSRGRQRGDGAVP